MRILTAGFDHPRSEAIGQALSDAGHTVLSASGAASCRTLASSVACDLLLVPNDSIGEDALSWAPDLLGEVAVVKIDDDEDPVTRLDALKAPRPSADKPTEQLDEEALVAAIGRKAKEAEAHDARDHASTEHFSEAAILATLDDERATLSQLPLPPPPALSGALLESPRRSATLRSAQAGPSLDDKLHDIRFGDYHAILELQPGASTYVVRQQYDALKSLYTPSGWHEALGPTEIDSLKEIGRGLDDAFSILGHPTYQSRYESALEASASPRA